MAPGGPRLATPGLAGARAQLVDLGRQYRAGTLGLPSPFFPAPDAIEPALAAQGEGPLGTQVVDLAWESGYVPFLPAAREPYAAHR